MHLDFATQNMVGGGRSFLPEIMGQIDLPASKTATSKILIFARSTSAVAPSKRSSVVH